MTITLLTDSQGKKMGKTAGNAVWLDADKTSPYEFYQYWRNVDDADVMKCLRMLTFLPLEQIEEMSSWKDQKLNKAKEILAWELTNLVHGEEAANAARDTSRALFSTGGAADMPVCELTADDLTDGRADILTLLVASGLCASRGDARRNVQQGGVEAGGQKVTDISASFGESDLAGEGLIVKKGKKNFRRIVLK